MKIEDPPRPPATAPGGGGAFFDLQSSICNLRHRSPNAKSRARQRPGCRVPSAVLMVVLAPCPRGRATARRQVFWLPDRPTCRAFPSPVGDSGSPGARPRSQRRVRDGLAPSSLGRRAVPSVARTLAPGPWISCAPPASAPPSAPGLSPTCARSTSSRWSTSPRRS